MPDQQPINPYAPTMSAKAESVALQTDDLPPSGIEFSGQLDVHSVRQTDELVLSIGLIIGLGFAGLLMIGGISAVRSTATWISPSGMVAAVFLAAAGLTLLAVWVFVVSQRQRPLREFAWMSGAVSGVVGASRIDIHWEQGDASLLFPKLSSSLEFVNRHGRLFVCHGIHCFVPANALEPGGWRQLQSFKPQWVKMPRVISPPPEPPAGAMTWDSSVDAIVQDQRSHHFVCRRPETSRLTFLSSAVLLFAVTIYSSAPPINAVTIVILAIMIISGLMWALREGVRRHWRFRYRNLPLSLWPSANHRSVPNYRRWITSDHAMVGASDGWVRLPWSAVAQLVISPYGAELRLRKGLAAVWFLERGDRPDDQWRAIVDRISALVVDTQLCGSLRRQGGSEHLPRL